MKIDKLIEAAFKAGESKDRIFINLKRGGLQMSAHELRHRINVVWTRTFYGRASR
ncbi:MAG: hypothetical protein WAX69_16715 [Victivallales bacterium]